MKTLLFSDFDFTMLVHGDPEQTNRNKQAIQEFRRRGGKFALATGRSPVSLMVEFPEYREYLDFLMVHDGALTYVVTPGGQEEIFRINIPPVEVRDVVRLVRETGGKFRRDVVYFCGEDERTAPIKEGRRMCGKFGVNKIRVWCEDNDDCLQLTEVLTRHKYNGFSYYDIPKENNFDIGRLHWVSNNAKSAIDVLPRDVSKGDVINALQKQFFQDYRIVTVGDAINDIRMIEMFDGYVIQTGALVEELPKAKTAKSLEEVLGKIMI